MGPSINDFLETHGALILRLARKLTRPPLHPEDVAQEVVASLLHWYRQGTFDPNTLENAEAYLRVAVRNRASREARRAHAEAPAPDADALSDEASLSSGGTNSAANLDEALEARAALERLKAALRPRDAFVLALLVDDGLDLEQVAQTLGITMNNVYQIRHRIRSQAREVLDAKTAESVRLLRTHHD